MQAYRFCKDRLDSTPLQPSRQHLVDGSKNHTGNGNNSSFLTTAFNDGFNHSVFFGFEAPKKFRSDFFMVNRST